MAYERVKPTYLQLTEQKYTQIGAATLRKSRHINFLCKVNTSVSTEEYNFLYIYCVLMAVYVFLDAATLTEVFPRFFLVCNSNARA